MSSSQTWSDSALPVVRDALRALAAAGPVSTAALFEGPHLVRGIPVDALRITGRDRVRFLHAMLSNDVILLDKAGPGHGTRATLSSVQGRLVADLHLYLVDGDKKDGSALALLEAGAAAPFVEMLDRYVIAEKVSFAPEDVVALALVGPGSTAALRASGAPVPDEGEHRHAAGTLGGVAARVVRRALGLPEGFLVLVAPGDVDAAVAGLGVAEASLQQLEAARIEAGLPRAGGDATPLHIALEAGLKDRAISFTKGCYIGQEVICRIDSMGTPARLLVQLSGGGEAPEPGAPLFVGGREVGYVTSSVHSSRVGAPVFLGYLKKRSNDVGTEVTVGGPDGATATVQAHV
jgi:folate-binding protein YgfZ